MLCTVCGGRPSAQRGFTCGYRFRPNGRGAHVVVVPDGEHWCDKCVSVREQELAAAGVPLPGDLRALNKIAEATSAGRWRTKVAESRNPTPDLFDILLAKAEASTRDSR